MPNEEPPAKRQKNQPRPGCTPPPPPKPYVDETGKEWPSKKSFKSHVKGLKLKAHYKAKRDQVRDEKKAKRAELIATGVIKDTSVSYRDPNKTPEQIASEIAAASARRSVRDARDKAARAVRAEKAFSVLVDCSFTSQLTAKEATSLANQITYCYAFNRRHPLHPLRITVASCDGVVDKQLIKKGGYPSNWELFSASNACMSTLVPKERLVYLTADSPNVISTLDKDKTYVIGGIVDRNRLRNATLNRATTIGIETARLPIDEYFNMCSTRVLTVNHVFEILSRWSGNGGDWAKAMMETFPIRKGAATKGEEEWEEGEEGEEVKGEGEGDEGEGEEEEEEEDGSFADGHFDEEGREHGEGGGEEEEDDKEGEDGEDGGASDNEGSVDEQDFDGKEEEEKVDDNTDGKGN